MKITEEQAKELYPIAPDSFKKELEENFGRETFIPNDVDKLSSYESALEIANRPDAKKISDIPDDLHDYFLKVYKCIVLCEVANKGEKIDIYNQSKNRYFPYFATNGSPSSFGFRDAFYEDSGAGAGGGSRLSFTSDKAARHLGKTFIKEFREMLES